MKPSPARNQKPSGHALAVVLVILSVALLILAGTLSWSVTNSRLNERSNQLIASLAAAEAATEKVMAEISTDYQKFGAAYVDAKMDTYRTRKPESNEHPVWGRYRFSNATGSDDRTYLQQVNSWAVSPLISQYQGLSGFAATYRLISNARELSTRNDIVGAVRQEFQIASIPLFQFAIFYNVDLEVNPGPNMTISGRVHSNQQLYTQPQATLTFGGDVTAAGNILHDHHPLDPTVRPAGTIVYGGEHDSGVNSLNMPLGVENTAENVRKIVEVPPTGESATSGLGQQRFYNRADLVVIVRDGSVEARGGTALGGTPTLAWSSISSFVSTNASFFNKREGRTVRATQIDVAGLAAWNAAGNTLKTALGRDISSIYVSDQRTQSSTTEQGVRLVNGQTLPPAGLTVATPDPLYVKGHYNVPSADIGTANTANTRPAAFIADAVTVLSGGWNDANSTAGLSTRAATSTTVNAAIMAGIVPTTAASYSGGVENFPRFLEDWSGDTFTYNGSMIVMFPSQYATGTWKGTGSTIGIYNPPTRNWSFDLNFLNPARLPPLTPEVRTVIRGQWTIARPNSTTS